MSTTSTTTPASDDNDPLMFDEALTIAFRSTCNAMFLKVPELRSVVVVYDYYRNLNDAPNFQMHAMLQQQLTEVSKELLEKKNELEALKKGN